MCSRCWAKEAYAASVLKNGFYLGILDLGLLARKRNKDLLLVYFDDEFKDTPGVCTVFEILEKMVPGCAMPPVEKDIDPASSSTWAVACERHLPKRLFPAAEPLHAAIQQAGHG